MRKLLGAIKGIGAILSAVVCALLLYAIRNAPVFDAGQTYTYYLSANSSDLVVQTQSPVKQKLFLGSTAGESTQYEGDLYLQLKEKFHAVLLFSEDVYEITNYYLYSPLLGDGVLLNGYAVNLHIAVSDERTAVGTPIIFGGY